MNSKIKYTLLLASLLIFASCNDSFLDREPTHNLNNANYWTSANDLKVYNNGIYNEAAKNEQALLRGHAYASNSKTLSFTALEALSDNFAVTDGDLNSWLVVGAGQEVIPSSIPTSGIGSNWRWEVLYRCNFFLENYQRATTVEAALRNNYAGEVYFMRAWFYFDKVREFGNVPLITHTLDITSAELFETQTDRVTVMDAVLSDINQAIEWLPDTWGTTSPDRATRWTAYALKSRICLFEGTFRKYHNIDGSEKFLREAADAADKLIQSGKHSLYNTGNPESDYRKIFTSTSLSGNPEVLLARVYEIPGLGHALSRNLTTMMAGATKDFVEDFLCIEPDGTAKPIALSSVYHDDEIEQIFDNRDLRLSQTILDPRMEVEIYHSDSKMFPRFKGMGSAFQSVTGYHFIKTFDYDDSQRSIGSEINDCALIRYAETLLDYAEAKAELGEITQADLDKSINKLRDRVGMPHLSLNPPMDPKYASEGISSLLVEIRRERRIELSFEYSRYFDLMRWKKGSYLIKPLLGMRVEDKDLEEGGRYAGAQIERVSIDGKKYVDPYAGMPVGAGMRTFDENKNYLHPVPINVLAKNPNLKQTPNWQN
jgi:hypothetical protein